MNVHMLFAIGISIVFFSVLFFIFMMLFQRQTLWSGFSFLCVLLILAVFAFFLLAYFSEQIQELPILYFIILFFGSLAAIFLLSLPVIILFVSDLTNARACPGVFAATMAAFK